MVFLHTKKGRKWRPRSNIYMEEGKEVEANEHIIIRIGSRTSAAAALHANTLLPRLKFIPPKSHDTWIFVPLVISCQNFPPSPSS
jgi:hypothetical protein